MTAAAPSKDTEKQIQEEFDKLLEDSSSPARFNHLVIKWLSFITTIISKHGIRSTDATKSYRLDEGWPTWNKNEDIIPVLGKKLGEEITSLLRPENISEFMCGLYYFETLFSIYKENAKEGIRLTRITKTPMAELFVHMGYQSNKEVLIFLLNLPEKEFQWIKDLVEAGGEKDMIIEKSVITQHIKELFFTRKELPLARTVDEVRHHQFPFPEKETMYGWVLEKYKTIPTDELERIVDTTRSIVLAKELKTRPAKQLSFAAFLATV